MIASAAAAPLAHTSVTLSNQLARPSWRYWPKHTSAWPTSWYYLYSELFQSRWLHFWSTRTIQKNKLIYDKSSRISQSFNFWCWCSFHFWALLHFGIMRMEQYLSKLLLWLILSRRRWSSLWGLPPNNFRSNAGKWGRFLNILRCTLVLNINFTSDMLLFKSSCWYALPWASAFPSCFLFASFLFSFSTSFKNWLWPNSTDSLQ